MLDRLGSEATTVGIDGALSDQPRLLSFKPSFSKLRLVSNVFFSCKIDSIVMESLELAPVSAGRPASATKLLNVYDPVSNDV